MNEQQPQPDYTAYWAAALARHKAMIAAGCISPVGAIRVSGGKRQDDEDQEQPAALGDG